MMESITIGAAFVAGLAGSGHCLGMCGPMAALANGPKAGLPKRGPLRALGTALIYNAGRISSYAFMGAVAGSVSWAVGQAAWLVEWSHILRVAAGALLVLIALQMLVPRWSRFLPMERLGGRVWARIAPLALRIRGSRIPARTFVFGMLWGWLPCGLVYSMLALATLSGSATNGALTMAAFGLGTLPVLLGFGSFASRIRAPRYRPALAAILMLSGIWLSVMPLMHLTAAPAEHAHHYSE